MARIGLDLDGTLLPFSKDFNAWALSRYPELADHILNPDDDPDEWDWFLKWPGWCKDKFKVEMDIACSSKKLFWIGEPYDPDLKNRIQGLRKLGHTVHVITHRFSEQSHDATHNWVNREMGWVEDIIFSSDKTSIPTDYFLEDNLDNYDALDKAGVKVYLVDRPYNLRDDDRRRVQTFGAFVDEVLRQEES